MELACIFEVAAFNLVFNLRFSAGADSPAAASVKSVADAGSSKSDGVYGNEVGAENR